MKTELDKEREKLERVNATIRELATDFFSMCCVYRYADKFLAAERKKYMAKLGREERKKERLEANTIRLETDQITK